MSADADPGPPFRPDLYVVARFLDRLAEPGTWTRSSLQPAVRLNYDQFRRYLAFIEARGWAAVEDGPGRSPRVRLTAAGHDARGRLLAWLGELFGHPPA